MKAHISAVPACAPRHDQPATSAISSTANVVRIRYRAHVGARRVSFVAPPVDLPTLVIADAIKRRTQAPIHRPALRDAYELPVAHERDATADADSRAPEDGEPD